MSAIRYLFVAALIFVAVDAAPFFDAIYDAINGNARRSYGYSGYGNNGYDGYGNAYANGYGQENGYGYANGGYGSYGYNRPRAEKQAPRHERTFKDICKVHFTASYEFPGKGGVVCPY